jgi:hypothetical protein
VNLNPALQQNAALKALQTGLTEIAPLMGSPETKSLTEDQVKLLADKAAQLAKIVTEPMKE